MSLPLVAFAISYVITISNSGQTNGAGALISTDVPQIDWGSTVELGSSVVRDVTITNLKTYPVTLTFTVTGMNPADLGTVDWNLGSSYVLDAGVSVIATFTLTVNDIPANGGQPFSFDINIEATAT